MSDSGVKWDSFATFGRRLTLRGTLRACTGLRVGSGQADDISGADMAVMKDNQRRPYIPGSSFKGALRAHVERLVRSLWPEVDTRLAACDSLVEVGRCIPGRWSRSCDARNHSGRSPATHRSRENTAQRAAPDC